jgi:hypothetical protein
MGITNAFGFDDDDEEEEGEEDEVAMRQNPSLARAVSSNIRPPGDRQTMSVAAASRPILNNTLSGSTVCEQRRERKVGGEVSIM